ncbi:MAG TPA: hypothetical protein ENM97_05155 [Moorella mulderi]|nr:hypothetical protein [Moorella mulderi]
MDRMVLGKDGIYHWAKIENLSPESLYCCQVETRGVKGPLTCVKTLPRPEGQLLFAFGVVSDTHLAMDTSAGDPNETYLGKLLEDALPLLQKALEDIHEWKAKAVFFTGDLTESSGEKEYRILAGLLSSSCLPWYACPGNHDKYQQRTGGIGEEGFRRFLRQDTPYHALFLQGYLFILLDSAQKDNDWGFIDPEQLDWLKKLLEENRQVPTFIFLHHPVNGPDIWFGARNFFELQKIIQRASNVQAVFCGHMHRNAITTNRWLGGSRPYIEVSATVQFPCGYGLVRVYEGGFEYGSHEISRLDLSEKSRRKVALGLGSLYSQYAFGSLADRSLSYLSDRKKLVQPEIYSLSFSVDSGSLEHLYTQIQQWGGASIEPATGKGSYRLILGRFPCLKEAKRFQRRLARLLKRPVEIIGEKPGNSR